MKGLMDGSDELSVHFKNNISRTSASMGARLPSTGEERIAQTCKFYHGPLIYTQLKQELIFGSYYFCFVQFSLFPPERKRGITGDVASRREAIRKRERRVVETEEERSRRLSTMAQRGQDRRAEETEEQRNSRLSDMAQRGQERRAEETEEQRNRQLAVMGQRSQQRRAEETEEQRKENTFWGERNIYVSDNICKKNKSEAGI
ncbi:hypothetical protein AVEN_204440-1 [Araneus ventricosus]|uniref:STPR domain-containing protein n=1 Tax=Araneus ventricosus TaxID=182803 RepID=A0A4Y2PPC3_ARAVE|nr:hypothetical protein AVEN_204440-1 [Araneus ventricosus]